MRNSRLLILSALLAFASLAQAAPADQLAPLPEATQVEKEVIGLLQIDRTDIDPSGNLSISLYNPSKYTLKNCAIRLQIPLRKIDRVYFSANTEIIPLHNGSFHISTQIENAYGKEFKCEIIKVSFDKPKS